MGGGAQDIFFSFLPFGFYVLPPRWLPALITPAIDICTKAIREKKGSRSRKPRRRRREWEEETTPYPVSQIPRTGKKKRGEKSDDGKRREPDRDSKLGK